MLSSNKYLGRLFDIYNYANKCSARYIKYKWIYHYKRKIDLFQNEGQKRTL